MEESQIDFELEDARSAIAEQFPQWADLELKHLSTSGTVNVMYRLGKTMVIRFPVLPEHAHLARFEAHWLQRLGPSISIEIPEPLGVGVPQGRIRNEWMVCRWIEGQGLRLGAVNDELLASQLASFVSMMQSVSLAGDEPTGYRAKPLESEDERVRDAIDAVGDEFDRRLLTSAWEESLAASDWAGPPVWHHGDLHPGNLITRDGNLAGVIDFTCAGIGDPGVDVMAAWWCLEDRGSQVFREIAAVDEQTWMRGRGWALAVAAIALPFYRSTNTLFANQSRVALNSIIEDL